MKEKITSIAAAICTIIMIFGTAALAQAANVSEIGSDRAEVHRMMGEGSESSDGLKETYRLSDGTEAVLHFDDDILVRGFILND